MNTNKYMTLLEDNKFINLLQLKFNLELSNNINLRFPYWNPEIKSLMRFAITTKILI